jgi:hypothetical protein
MKKQRLRSRRPKLTAVRTLWADHTTPLNPQNLALGSSTIDCRSVSIVGLWTNSHGFRLFSLLLLPLLLLLLLLMCSARCALLPT